LRGRLSFGATFAVVMSDYVDRMADVGGHLILSGVEAELMDQLRTSGGDDIEEHVTVYEASSIIGESTNEALDAGQDWLRDRE
jgi:SulP family sulfate permease